MIEVVSFTWKMKDEEENDDERKYVMKGCE